MKNLRLYTFCNFYLSSLQHGLQSAHVVSELFVKYPEARETPMLYDWAANHKTIIVCNGGMARDIDEGFETLRRLDHNFPMAKFDEEFGALGPHTQCTTAFGIILPEKIYSAVYDPRSDMYFYTDENDNLEMFNSKSIESQIRAYVIDKPLAR